MRILAVITEPQQVRKILLHLIKTGKAPPALAARTPRQSRTARPSRSKKVLQVSV